MSDAAPAHDARETCPTPPDAGCDSLSGRRDFLRNGLMAVAALTALGVSADRLHALERLEALGTADGDLLRYPLPTADGATIDAENEVIVARFEGRVHAFKLECPHRGNEVEWQGDRGRFYCPKHKSTFRPEGSLIGGKAERGLDRYAVRREGEEIVVDTSVVIRSDRDADAWSAAAVTL